MTVLVVDDDDHKRDVLVALVKEKVPFANVDEAKSYQHGMRSIEERHPDLIVLDMHMPTYVVSERETGGRPKVLAGREIIREIQRKRIKTRVVVVTQFETFGEGKEALTLQE